MPAAISSAMVIEVPPRNMFGSGPSMARGERAFHARWRAATIARTSRSGTSDGTASSVSAHARASRMASA